MGVLKLHGIDGSPPVRGAKLTLAALGLDYEYVHVNLLTLEHLKEDYKKKNPQHTVPLLEDDDYIIWDSHAIAAYLVTVYGKDDSLYPRDPKKRAVVDQRLHFDSGILFPRLRGLTEPILFRNSGSVNEEDVAKIPQAYDFLEKFLNIGDYLAGDDLTIADFCAVANVVSLEFYYKIEAHKYPKITAWLERMAVLPYYEENNGEGARQFAHIVAAKLNNSL